MAASGGTDNAQARAVVLHPGVPDWFNRTLDGLQARAWSRALDRCGLGPGDRVLDVGCGTGRWLERLLRRGALPMGTDCTEAMLRIAQERLRDSTLVAAVAQRLPFADASFNAVLAVTVVQHIPRSEQARAIAEMARVARPSAFVVLLDLIRGADLHAFPHPPKEWVGLGSGAGLEPVDWFGQEFLLFDRLLCGAAFSVRSLIRGKPASQLLALPTTKMTPNPTRRAYWTIRRLAVALSLAAEPLAERLLPQSFATHGLFIFRKPSRGA